MLAAAARTGRDVGTYVPLMVNADETDEAATAKSIALPEGAINSRWKRLSAHMPRVARVIDEAAGLPSTKGLMLTFDDFLMGMEQFG